MTDIFIAYAREDQRFAQRIAEAMEEKGLSVWWDIRIPAGAVWRDVILEALTSSTMVIVLWSQRSVKSEWVLTEARLAVDQNKLVPAIIDKVEIPLGFSHIQHVDLSNWTGEKETPPFKALVDAAYEYRGEKRHDQPPRPDSPGDRVVVDVKRPYTALPGASRIRVFLAHASADKPKLLPVVTTLIDQGFQIWVDKPQEIGLDRDYESRLARDRIRYGHDWKESIRLAVKKARVVLAFWSQDAVKGRREQFHYEVYLGMMQKKLNQCRIDHVDIEEIGMPYTFDHIADLADIVAGEYHPELEYLMQDIVDRHRPWWSF